MAFQISRLHDFQPGTKIVSSEVEEEFDQIIQYHNDLDAGVDDHIQDTSNPHSVTAAQVGLGNVDNTSDVDKPVSTAQQAALDLKVSIVAGESLVSDTLIAKMEAMVESETYVETDSTTTAITQALAVNTQYIYSNTAITSLGITLSPGYSAGFIASVVFISPSSAPSFNLTNTGSYTLKLRGDGTISGTTYTPSASRTCTVIFSYDGINMNIYISEM